MKKYCTNLLYFIFLFHHEGGQAGKNLSLWEKVCLSTQNVVNLLCNLSTTYFMEDMERTSFQNFIFNLHLIFWKVCPAILCWPQGEKFSFWSFSGWKGELKQCNICIISSNSKFLYYSIHQMWENNTKCF